MVLVTPEAGSPASPPGVRITRRVTRVAAMLKGAAALLVPMACMGQQSVRSAVLVADLTGGAGAALVRVEFVVEGIDAGQQVDASVMDFGASVVSDVRSGVAGEPAPLRPLQGVARGTRLRVEPGREPGTARVVVTYRVDVPVTEAGGKLRGRVPVLGIDRAPREAGPGLFRAELRVPPQWVITEGFPTGLAPSGEPGVYRAELSVVPSLVSFRARADGAWRPGLPVLLDVLAGGILLVFAAFGWRHMREVAA